MDLAKLGQIGKR